MGERENEEETMENRMEIQKWKEEECMICRLIEHYIVI